MSIESAELFIARMKTDVDFSQKVASYQDLEERRAFLGNAGYDFSASELKRAGQKLDDSALAGVTGGVIGLLDIT
ncbi:MAG: Nif11-like leader peptide family natural product precursor [Syntrophomonadaceae bacterium]